MSLVVTDPNPDKLFGSNEDVPNDIDDGDLVMDDVVEAGTNEKVVIAVEAPKVKVSSAPSVGAAAAALNVKLRFHCLAHWL